MLNVQLQKRTLLFTAYSGGKFVFHFQCQYLILFHCWLWNKTTILIWFGLFRNLIFQYYQFILFILDVIITAIVVFVWHVPYTLHWNKNKTKSKNASMKNQQPKNNKQKIRKQSKSYDTAISVKRSTRKIWLF